MTSPHKETTLGFLGSGAMAEALVTGLCTAARPAAAIYLSRRGERISADLQSRFSQVTICSENQQVVDHADILFLSFLPKDYIGILQPLHFRKGQIVVNLLGGMANERIEKIIGGGCRVVRAVPLPYVALHVGPVLLYPHCGLVEDMLARVGEVFVCEREEQLATLSAVTALMAPYFELLAHISSWAADHGVQGDMASRYSASMFAALSHQARHEPKGDLAGLADRSMTPGGLNELARRTIAGLDGFSPFVEVLEKVGERVAISASSFRNESQHRGRNR